MKRVKKIDAHVDVATLAAKALTDDLLGQLDSVSGRMGEVYDQIADFARRLGDTVGRWLRRSAIVAGVLGIAAWFASLKDLILEGGGATAFAVVCGLFYAMPALALGRLGNRLVEVGERAAEIPAELRQFVSKDNPLIQSFSTLVNDAQGASKFQILIEFVKFSRELRSLLTDNPTGSVIGLMTTLSPPRLFVTLGFGYGGMIVYGTVLIVAALLRVVF